MTMSPDLYKENFQEIIETVNKKYSHFENKSIDKDSLSALYLSKVNNEISSQEYIDILLKYFAALENGHSFLKLPKYFINSWANLVEKRIFITGVYDSILLSHGINNKDEILKIDGIPAYSWLLENTKYTNASTEEARINWTADRVFGSYLGGKRIFEIKTNNGIKTVELEFKKINPTVLKIEDKTYGKIINDSIGYINIPSMYTPYYKDFLIEFDKLKNLPNLIIDLRDNGGGNTMVSERILTHLIKEPLIACASTFKKKPKKNYFKGSLYILTGINTFSAAENIVIDLKESNSAVIIGSPTGGDTGNNPKSFQTKHGFGYRFPTRQPPQVSQNGFPMEGIGIEPHFVIYQTIEDYLRDIDTVLEFTINKIKGNSP